MTKDYTLDELVRIEDALEAIKDGTEYNDYLLCNKEQFRIQYAEAWDRAQTEIWIAGSVRKALNRIRAEIKEYR